ncbi:MAG: S-methyl-5'-thioinosine phosphorylase [Pseudomonadales bacterium]|nr:S-methyl-5'-thioinosine phosphorylase [Pseudomonadales bacterium]
MQDVKLAIIGGSSLTSLEQLGQVESHTISTSYGKPSSDIQIGEFGGEPVAFLARHGSDYQTPPHLINYQANIAALKKMGVEKILAVNTVGGIHPSMPAGSIVIPDQLIDYTWGRASTYSDQGNVIFIEFEKPFDQTLRQHLQKAAQQLQLSPHNGAVYGCTQGPRLETAAEINRLERDGCDLVGMTAMPEAALARELGMAYASVCLVVNPAAGRSDRPICMSEVEKVASVGMLQVVQLLEAAVVSIAN